MGGWGTFEFFLGTGVLSASYRRTRFLSSLRRLRRRNEDVDSNVVDAYDCDMFTSLSKVVVNEAVAIRSIDIEK